MRKKFTGNFLSQEELNLLKNFAYAQCSGALSASIQKTAPRSFRTVLEAGLAVIGQLLGKFIVLWQVCLFYAWLPSYLETVFEVVAWSAQTFMVKDLKILLFIYFFKKKMGTW